MNDIYWVLFSERDGHVICLCQDKVSCVRDCKNKCEEYLLNFTKIERKAEQNFSIDKATINKLKRAQTELEKTLKKVKI